MYLSPEEAAALLRGAARLSAPSSALIVHNSTPDVLAHIAAGGEYDPFPPALLATWRSSSPGAWDPAALADAMRAAGGWRLLQATSRARIAAAAAAACGSKGDVSAWADFEVTADEGRDRWAVFFTAGL